MPCQLSTSRFMPWPTGAPMTTHLSKRQILFFAETASLPTCTIILDIQVFMGWLEMWEKQGLLSKGWSGTGVSIKCFDHGISDGICHPGNIFDLVPHSRLVNFVVTVRYIFMDQFGKHKHLFPGVYG
mmetsp:Transcript_5655/g.11660  ORF Transcript_5655/g.11660 Transcript_5655/m.11660 type:complete len:127 (+) Transcript_5655:350-730(+)